MTSIDSTAPGTHPAPDAPHPGATTSRLLQRIATLERIIEQEPVNGLRPQLLESMLRRLKLLERMVARIGVDESRGLLVGLLVREAESSCMSCGNAAQCRQWLDSDVADDAYRRFCANAALFDLLPHKVL